MATRRKMERFLFWLNTNNEDEQALVETISTLKKERSFARTIRQGIQLIVALRQRDTTLLFELFPWLLEDFTHTNVPANKRHEDSLKDQLRRLEQLIVQQGNVPIEPATPALTGLSPINSGGPKPIAGASELAPPDLEFDFDLEIKKDEDAGKTASNNLRNTLMAMYNGTGAWAGK